MRPGEVLTIADADGKGPSLCVADLERGAEVTGAYPVILRTPLISRKPEDEIETTRSVSSLVAEFCRAYQS